MRTLALALLTLAAPLVGCGGAPETETFRVSLRMNALPCDSGIPGLQADLGIPEHDTCPLDVSADRTISGVCPRIATGREYQVRLRYFVQLSAEERVDIAVIYQDVDLIAPSDESVVVQFPDARLDTNFDDDNDSMSNIAEVCVGRDPKRAGD